MFATTRRYTMEGGSVEEVARDVQENFLPTISDIPGFQAYYVIKTGERKFETISIFDTRQGAEESTKRAATYVKGRPKLAPNLPKPPEISMGEVVAHREAPHPAGAR